MKVVLEFGPLRVAPFDLFVVFAEQLEVNAVVCLERGDAFRAQKMVLILLVSGREITFAFEARGGDFKFVDAPTTHRDNAFGAFDVADVMRIQDRFSAGTVCMFWSFAVFVVFSCMYEAGLCGKLCAWDISTWPFVRLVDPLCFFPNGCVWKDMAQVCEQLEPFFFEFDRLFLFFV